MHMTRSYLLSQTVDRDRPNLISDDLAADHGKDEHLSSSEYASRSADSFKHLSRSQSAKLRCLNFRFRLGRTHFSCNQKYPPGTRQRNKSEIFNASFKIPDRKGDINTATAYWQGLSVVRSIPADRSFERSPLTLASFFNATQDENEED